MPSALYNRKYVQNGYYYIYHKSSGGKELFRDEDDYLNFVKKRGFNPNTFTYPALFQDTTVCPSTQKYTHINPTKYSPSDQQ